MANSCTEKITKVKYYPIFKKQFQWFAYLPSNKCVVTKALKDFK